MIHGQSLWREPVERFKIVQRLPGVLKIQAHSQTGQLLPDGFLTLVRVDDTGTGDTVSGGE
jgi:hypothetical protein